MYVGLFFMPYTSQQARVVALENFIRYLLFF